MTASELAEKAHLRPRAGPYTVMPPTPDCSWTVPPPFPIVSADLAPPSSPVTPASRRDSLYAEVPRCQATGAISPLVATASSLSSLSRAELELRVLRAEAAVDRYAAAARHLLSGLALSPTANAGYSAVARGLVRNALLALPSVSAVDLCECSFPAVASGAEAPALVLAHYDGLGYSEWEVDWRPASWWHSVALTTTLGLRVRVHVSALRVVGRVRVALSDDLSAVRLSFAGSPVVELSIETTVSIAGGYVPIPVRDTIDEGIRAAVSGFVRDNLVDEKSMVFVLRRRPPSVSEEEVAAALEAAQRQSSIMSLV
jgi:hypothetical protein